LHDGATVPPRPAEMEWLAGLSQTVRENLIINRVQNVYSPDCLCHTELTNGLFERSVVGGVKLPVAIGVCVCCVCR